ncbi:MAG: tRNA uridine(34) 5-carboxymethylaminomethyl modification radical SAM/GNAT enzyme Elp3 [Chloroflexota bacterium]
MKKTGRTISGVTPVAVVAKPMPCPGECIYCPTFSEAPQSYTPESPAVLRALVCGYDAGKQVAMRLRILSEMGHPVNKVELIILGGTFLAYPTDYQYQFIKDCFDALNGKESGNLEEAKHTNETAERRCVGLCIETRPDWCGEAEIKRLLDFGTTRVELGVQMIDDEIYRLVKRGHTVADVVKATRLLKEHGLKVHYHWMPGLPGATPEHDLELSKRLFSDDRFRPDGLKLYPTMVIAGTTLERWQQEGRYHPYDDATMIEVTCNIKEAVPRYVRISRVLRDIPSKFIVGGLKDSLRDIVRVRMKEKGTACQCIRCREYGHRLQDKWQVSEPKLVRMDYEASGGKEVFLSFEDENGTLFGLLRLRIQSHPVYGIETVSGGNMALVRELHIYGPEVPIKGKKVEAAQHKGLGKALLREAERIARDEFHAPLMAILSGVGAREYYRTEFGYHLDGDYMVRGLARPLPSATGRDSRTDSGCE